MHRSGMDTKAALRALLLSSKHGVPVGQLAEQYRTLTGGPLRLGDCHSELELLRSMPDCAYVRMVGDELTAFGVETQATGHICGLIRRTSQRGSGGGDRRRQATLAGGVTRRSSFNDRLPSGRHLQQQLQHEHWQQKRQKQQWRWQHEQQQQQQQHQQQQRGRSPPAMRQALLPAGKQFAPAGRSVRLVSSCNGALSSISVTIANDLCRPAPCVRRPLQSLQSLQSLQ